MSLIKLNMSGHENATLTTNGYTTICLHVDLTDSDLPTKVVAFLQPYITSGDVVQLVAPGLAPLAVLVITAIHGLSGTFPILVPMVRGDDGFAPGTPINLQDVRNDIGRTARTGIVVL